MRPGEAASALHLLPLVRWAAHFHGGVARVRGRGFAGALPGGLALGPEPVELALTFEGGPAPRVVELCLRGALVGPDGPGHTLDLSSTRALLDEAPLGIPLRPDLLAEAVVRGLSDVSARVEVVPDGELLVKFQHGVQAVIAAHTVLTVEGSTTGPPDRLHLSAPLVLSLNGGGMRLSHRRFERLASLASVRIEGASLLPDGEVRLRGGAHAAIDRLAQGGLERAGARLSDLIRRSPRFARVRAFLSR